MNFPDAVKSVYSQYVTFSGRSLRSEYWYFILFYVIVGIALAALGIAIGVPGILENLFYLASFLPTLAVAVRRLHDVRSLGMVGFASNHDCRDHSVSVLDDKRR